MEEKQFGDGNGDKMRWFRQYGMHVLGSLMILAVAGLWAAGIVSGVLAVPASGAPLEKVTALYLMLALAAASIIVITMVLITLFHRSDGHRRHRRILH